MLFPLAVSDGVVHHDVLSPLIIGLHIAASPAYEYLLLFPLDIYLFTLRQQESDLGEDVTNIFFPGSQSSSGKTRDM